MKEQERPVPLEAREPSPVMTFILEHKRAFTIAGAAIFPVLTFFTFETASLFNLFGPKMIPWYVGSGAVYIAGRIFDMRSTVRFFHKAEEARALGIAANPKELSSVIPTYLKEEREIFNPKKILVDSLLLIPGLTFPPVAVSAGIFSFIASGLNSVQVYECDKQIAALQAGDQEPQSQG